MIDEVFRFLVRANTRSATRQMGEFNRTLAKTNRGLNGLGVAFGGIAIGRGIRTLTQSVDTFININNQVNLIARKWDDVAQTQTDVFDIAQRTRSTYESTATLVARIGRSSERLGASQDQVLAAVEAVNQTFRISGSTTREATASAIQFAQALGKGRLDGDELRGILEGNLRLSQSIADTFGVSVDELKDLGAEGRLISSTIIQGILDQAGQINEEFEVIQATFADTGTLLDNTMTRFLGNLDQAIGLSGAVYFFAQGISEELDDALPKVASAAASFKKLLTGSLIGLELGNIKGDIEDAQEELAKLEAQKVKFNSQTNFRDATQGKFDSVFSLFGVDDPSKDIEKQKRAIAGLQDLLKNTEGAASKTAEKQEKSIDGLLKKLDSVRDRVFKTEGGGLGETELEVSLGRVDEKLGSLQLRASAGLEELGLRLATEEADAWTAAFVEMGASLDRAREKALLMQAQVDAVANVGEAAFTSFFDNLEDGFGNAAKAFTSVWLDAIRDVLISKLANQFAELLVGGFGGGLGAVATSVFGGFGKTQVVSAGANRDGGSYTVPGTGAADSQLLTALVSPGEDVVFTPKKQQGRSGGGVTINQPITINGAGVSMSDVEVALARSRKETIAVVSVLNAKGRI